MGYYIQTDGVKCKAKWLVENARALTVSPGYFDASGKSVGVCVVSNPAGFEAAGIIYRSDEAAAFNRSQDKREKIWLAIPRVEAIRLCPEVEKDLPAEGKAA